MTPYVERYRGSLPARLLLLGILLVVLPWGRWDRLTTPSQPTTPGGPENDFLDTLSAALSIPAVVFGCLLIAGAAVQTVWTARRRVAFAADENGLYLGAHLLPPARPTRIPWDQVSRVQLRQVKGVPHGSGAGATWNRLVIHGRGRGRLAARLVDGWRLDRRKLADAISSAAPSVRLDR
ncbi:hypothetical protein E1293_22970 [Actinomadura darangshiensis]|uniref:Uncharacterized protein n=1 Tax=Actinomadura darangshiensis TaxID=705336 RepID=A0A4R5B1U5_9ACTN|nr:hypothetical protein [Actinomadura darangshiensis]TDD79611.1 hypothetical protein E1293_22970 [Actinomadura darangshiensis]